MGVSFLYGTTGGKKEKDNRSVYVRVTYNDLNWKKTLKMNIQKSEWDFNKKMVKSLSSGNRSHDRSIYLQSIIDKIDELGASLEKWLTELKITGRLETISIDEFRRECEDIYNNKTDRDKDQPTYLVDLIQMYIDLNVKHKEWSYNTLRSYKSRLKAIKRFEEETRRKYYINEIDLNFYNDFKEWAYEHYAPNSFGGFIRNIKATLRYYRRFEYPVHPHVDDPLFRDVKERVDKLTLLDEEIEKIFNFEGNEKLNNVRDCLKLLYFGCMRYSDLVETIKDGYDGLELYSRKGELVWKVKQPKTRKTNPFKIIPVLPEIQNLLRENALPRTISNAKFNEYIKVICNKVGIVKDVSSHDFRRSYVTNEINRGEEPKKVTRMSGHKTWSAFDTYCKNNNIEW